MKALNDQVITAAIKDDAVNGLVIPDSAQDKPQRGTVLSFGPEVKGVNEGDKVLFRKSSALKVSDQGVDYIIVRGKDLIAIL